MAIVPFAELMADARKGGYAVGYFESWNLESLFAVADAAEATRSPVILGVSGIALPNPNRVVPDRLSPYAALGLDLCKSIDVPVCLLFNESADMGWLKEAVDLGFHLVMFTDEHLTLEDQTQRVQELVDYAHPRGVAVEGELTPLAGATGGEVTEAALGHMSDIEQAVRFVEATGVDALAVEIGQAHLHGRSQVRLNLNHLRRLTDALSVPLVLHGSSSVARQDLAEAARLGIAKINVGSNLKRTYLGAIRKACNDLGPDYNPYDVVGSGLPQDVMTASRVALQELVEELMHVFGSAGKA